MPIQGAPQGRTFGNNHFEVVCRSKSPRSYSHNPTAHTGSVIVRGMAVSFTKVAYLPVPTMTVKVKTGSKEGHLTCVPDTGAEANVVSNRYLRSWGVTEQYIEPLPQKFFIGNHWKSEDN